MEHLFKLLGDDGNYIYLEENELKEFIQNEPRNAKRALARTIVADYHGIDAALKSEKDFDSLFIEKKTPDNINLSEFENSEHCIVNILLEVGAVSSKTEARKMIQQNAVSIDGVKIVDSNELVLLDKIPKILRLGKRKFYKIALK